MTDSKKQQALQRVLNKGWFSGLDDNDVIKLVSLSHIKTYKPEDLIYASGEKQENLYCIVDGLVKISLVSKEGDYFPLTLWEAGSWFGEGSLSHGSIMPVEASVVDETTVIVVPISAIDKALDNGAMFYKNILSDVITRTQLLFKLVDMLLFKTLQARVAARMLHLVGLFGEATSSGIKLPIEFSQSDIAGMSGGSRQRVNKIFGKWSSDGVVTKQEKWYVVHDIQALEAEAD